MRKVKLIVSALSATVVAAGLAILMSHTTMAAGNVVIDDTNFPDSNFRSYVSNNIDNGDGVLTDEEIEKTTRIDVMEKNISSLEGVGYFTALKELYCNGNKLISLDMSKNTELEILSCQINQLTSINVRGNSALYYFICDRNQLTNLDVSTNTALYYLSCRYNQLTSLDVKKNKVLSRLECYSNQITQIDLSNNPSLTDLSCGDNQLKSLDVSKNRALKNLYCGGNLLTSLDLSNNLSLEYLSCVSNQITTLDVSKNTSLEHLDCRYNKFGRVFLSKELQNYDDYTCDDGANIIVLTPSDWKCTGVDWKLNNTTPSKTTAVAKFECTKEGSTDYKVSEPMTVTYTSVKATVGKAGKIVYSAKLTADYSRTGTAVSDSKTVVIPAIKPTATPTKKPIVVPTKKATVAPTKKPVVSPTQKPTIIPTKKATVAPTKKPTIIPTKRPAAKPTLKPTLRPTAKPGVSLKLNTTSANVVCGKKLMLTATLTGSNAKISWRSSDSEIATVDANGKISAKKAGPVIISASAAGKTVKCNVQVLYKDVTDSKKFWFKPTNYLTNTGVVRGYDDQTKFIPGNYCIRAQMVTFLWRLQGCPAPKTKKCKFSDVKKGAYYYEACIWGSENGIVEGYKDGTFGPRIECARRHAVTFLWRLAGKPDPKAGTKNKFKDVKKSAYYYKAALWASEQGILSGYKDGTFRPNGVCLRRQMVTFLYKYDKYVNGKG